MGRFRSILVLIGSVWLSSCGESEHLQRARSPDADTETILTSYAKHQFPRNADIEVNVWDDEQPPLYSLDVDQFGRYPSMSVLRLLFTNSVSSAMRRISEDERLKKYKGDNRFSAYVEREYLRGTKDTVRAMLFILPNDLDVVWDAMIGDEERFLKFLHNEMAFNKDQHVHVKFGFSEIRPDYWR